MIPLMLQGDGSGPAPATQSATAENGLQEAQSRHRRTESTARRTGRPASMFLGRMFGSAEESPIVPTSDVAQDTTGAWSAAQAEAAARREARLRAQIEQLQATIETKDLTTVILKEKLEDAQQEVEVLKGKMKILEATFLSTGDGGGDDLRDMLAGVMLTDRELGAPPAAAAMGRQKSSGLESLADSAIGSDLSCSPTRSDVTFWNKISFRKSPLLKSSVIYEEDAVPSMDGLRDENAALKAEVARLNAALEDGLGALAELGL